MTVYYPKRFDFSIKGAQAYENIEDVPSDVSFLVASAPDFEKNKTRFTNIEVLQLPSSGYDALDLDYLKNNQIQCANAKGIYSEGIAQYVMAHLLNQYQAIRTYSSWEPKITTRSLTEKKVLILGTGDIGSLIAKRIKAFDTHVIGANSNGRLIDNFDQCIALDETLNILPTMDIIISTLPSNLSTKGFINKAFFEACKEDAILINIGRGDLLDEDALKLALETHFQHVILDVFQVEPLPEDSWLWNHPKVTVTPHNSFYSEFNNTRFESLVQRNLDLKSKGNALENKII